MTAHPTGSGHPDPTPMTKPNRLSPLTGSGCIIGFLLTFVCGLVLWLLDWHTDGEYRGWITWLALAVAVGSLARRFWLKRKDGTGG